MTLAINTFNIQTSKTATKVTWQAYDGPQTNEQQKQMQG